MALTRIRLTRCSDGEALYTGRVPQAMQRGWKLLILASARPPSAWIAKVSLGRQEAGHRSQEVSLTLPFRPHGFGFKFIVLYCDHGAEHFTARLYGHPSPPDAVSLTILALPRGPAGILACLQNLGAFRRALSLATGSIWGRIRKALSITAKIGPPVPPSYAQWIALFDQWPTSRVEAFASNLAKIGTPSIEVFVFSAGPADAPPAAATFQSLQSQMMPPAHIALGWSAPAADYVAVLQAGEVLPPHALLVLAAEAARRGFPAVLMGDEDGLGPDGSRTAPMFKPEPSLPLICSGTLLGGVWLIRRDLAETMGGGQWAECIRLAAWFGARARGLTGVPCRVPHVLTHRRTDTERAPVTDLAQEVERCLEQASIPAVVEAGFPVKTRRLPGALASRKIDIVIPSKLSSDLTINCMAEVIGRTLHRNFEMRVVVTQTGNLTDTQLRARERLCADERVRVEILNRPAFNYSLANNFGAAQLSGEFICLLNDDVQPMDGDWLDGMLSFFTDESVGIVGAKLYYPNMTVQHGGVIIGLAGLCEHANRYLPKGEPGYAWRGELDQEFSAVTGACLLVRRDIFNAVGGLNEAYATGFNDVDFCLRVRELGYAVVFAGSVEMIHHETVTFGHHYAGDPEREATDIQRMRARWGDVVSCDPFHNPNLSLVAGSEWMPSFPPRG